MSSNNDILDCIKNFKTFQFRNFHYTTLKLKDVEIKRPNISTVKKSTGMYMFKIFPKFNILDLYDRIELNEYISGVRYRYSKNKEYFKGQNAPKTLCNTICFCIGIYTFKIFTNGVLHICNVRYGENYEIAHLILQYISNIMEIDLTCELSKATIGYNYEIRNTKGRIVNFNLNEVAMIAYENTGIIVSYNNVEDPNQITLQLDNGEKMPFLTFTKKSKVTIKTNDENANIIHSIFWNIISRCNPEKN